MMDVVREWLLGITGAAILAALAEGLMPEGAVKQVGKLVCGLVLLLAVIRPVGELVSDELDARIEAVLTGQYGSALQEETDSRMKTIIEEKMEAYSMDKAAQMGVVCSVQITCAPSVDGVFLPEQAQVEGVPPDQQHTLMQFLHEDLGLLPEQIRFRGGAVP